MVCRSLVTFVFVSAIAMFAAGCSTISRASVQQGDIVTSAEVERLPKAGEFRTQVVIVQIDATGGERVMAAPTLISRAGESATISVENESEKITVIVRIPDSKHYDEGAEISIKVEQAGKLVSAPRMVVQVPN